MEVDLANMLFGWLFHIDLANIASNSPGTTATGAAGAAGAAGGTGLGLRDLFGPWPRPGVGDTENPQYSDTTAEDRTAADNARIAADEARQQGISDYYKNTHPGATTAGPPPPTTAQQGGRSLHRGLREYIIDQR